MISAVFCVIFGFSLLPGRKPLCIRFTERISDGIMPEGAETYCRRLTWIWFITLIANSFLPVFFLPLFIGEWFYRRRRFRVEFHTSGSTGKSKTIVKTFDTLAKEVAMHRRSYVGKLEFSRLTFLGTVDPVHMLGKLWMDLLPKAMGAKSVDEIILTPETLIDRMKAADQVFLVTTPSFLSRFVAYADQYQVPQNVVEIVTSGAALPPDVSARTREVFGVEPKQIFGSTETGGVAWMRGDMPPTVFDGVKVKSVDGRLAVKSPFSFKFGWYVMGDGAEIAEDGRTFRLLGRMDRLVKINEERVNLAEMEDRVRALGYRDCSCIALDGQYGKYLALVLVGEAESELVLRTRFAAVFPKGAAPRRFRFVSELPRNTQGKVLRSEIEKLF